MLTFLKCIPSCFIICLCRYAKLSQLNTSLWNSQFSSVVQSHPTLCNPMDWRMPGLPCASPTPGAYSNSCPLCQRCHPTISFSVTPFSSCHQSFSASGSLWMSQLSCIRWSKYWSFSISPSNEYSRLIPFWINWFDLLDVQGTLKSLLQHHSLALSLFYCPALTSVHDYWKNHSFDNMDLCRQSNVCFLICCLGLS